MFRGATRYGQGCGLRARCIALMVGCVLVGWVPSACADSSPTPATPASSAATPAASAEPRVLQVCKLGCDETTPVVACVGDVLVVKVQNLAKLLEQETKDRKLVLFLDDLPLEGLNAYPPLPVADGQLRFTLNRTAKSNLAWMQLLAAPSIAPRPLRLSVGFPGEPPIATDVVESFTLRTLPPFKFWFWASMFVVILLVFLAVATKSDLLRDRPQDVSSPYKPFSLARSQAAWWFFLILASYLFIGIVTGDFMTSITSTVLTLIGISAATTAGGVLVDKGRPTKSPAGSPAAQPTAVPPAVAGGGAAAGGGGAAAAPPGGAAPAVPPTPPAALPPTLGPLPHFISDILSDEEGVAFHRFQLAAWTVVLGIVFVMEVYQGLRMPEFSATLLSLLGISAGTYVGLKIPEAVAK